MPRAINLTGDTFGRLRVLRFAGHAGKERVWRCACECGAETTVSAHALRSGNTTSCGCLRLERIRTHNLSSSPEYSIWKAARNRCHNPKAQGYADYGERGITMCQEWRASFAAFIRDMGRRPSAEHSINRKDNDGPYSPDNCEWATAFVQNRNRRDNHVIDFRGRSQTITDWAAGLGMSSGALLQRLQNGWSVAEALTEAADRFENRHDSMRLTLNGVTKTLPQWARHVGIHTSSLRERIQRGWPLEKALTARKTRRHAPPS